MISAAVEGASPLVSVIIPAYNAERFIRQTLESVLAQTYKNIEVLVVDDGSQDQTADIVREIADRDDRIILLSQVNSGVAAARNLAIQHSKGEFIAPIDADDIWYPLNIEKQVQRMLQTGPEVGLVYSWSIDIDEDDTPVGKYRASRIEGSVYLTLLLHDFIANASCVLIRRSCLEAVGGYDKSLKEKNGQGGEDWDIYLRIAESYQFQVIPEFLVSYRKHPNSMSENYAQMAQSRYLIWQSIRGKYPSLPALLERFSNSSFYINLAKQSSRSGQYGTTLLWLLNAFKLDSFIFLLRLDAYTLLIKAALKLSLRAKVLNINIVNTLIPPFRIATSKSQPTHKFGSTNHPFNKNLKVLAEQLLHQLSPVLFGSPKKWQVKSAKEH